MNIFLTGGTGFVGSLLAKTLADNNHHVTVLVRETSNTSYLDSIQIKTVTGSLFNIDGLKKNIANTDMIIHNAAVVTALNSKAFYVNNVEASVNLMKAACSNRERLRQFIFISSQAAAGPAPPDRPLTEMDIPHPVVDYGASKWQAEQCLREYSNEIPLTILRPCSIYGPRDTSFFKVFQQALKGRFVIAGSGKQLLNFLYVVDFVHAILRVVEGKIPETSATYFVKGPGEHSWYDFKHALEKAMERSLKVIRVPTFLVGAAGYLFSLGSWITRKPNIINKDKMREVQEQRWLIDSSAFEQAYSYKPEWGLEHGLRETYRWYREANWL